MSKWHVTNMDVDLWQSSPWIYSFIRLYITLYHLARAFVFTTYLTKKNTHSWIINDDYRISYESYDTINSICYNLWFYSFIHFCYYFLLFLLVLAMCMRLIFFFLCFCFGFVENRMRIIQDNYPLRAMKIPRVKTIRKKRKG